MRSQSALALVAAAAAALSACSSGSPASTSPPNGNAGTSGAASGAAGSSGSGAASGSQGTGGGSGSGNGTSGSTSGGSAGAGEGVGSAGSAGTAGSSGSAGSAGSSGSSGSSGSAGSAGSGGSGSGAGPCDLYQSANTPCVAAHSTARALYGAYNGKLYQVRRASDNTTQDIPVLSAGGFADSAKQDTFCTGTTCTISLIYDQSPMGNDMPKSPPVAHLANGGKETKAAAAKIMVGGHVVYGVYVEPDGGGGSGNSYRNNKAKGLATGDQPEAMYMVVDGKRYNDRCCFDYGNVETTGNDDGNATMEALEFGSITLWSPGADTGPWVLTDLENGVFAGNLLAPNKNTSNTALAGNYLTLMLKDPSSNHLTLKGADAQSGMLAVKYDGNRPNGYSPQKKQGAVELGVGGDGSSGGMGTFFEGAVTMGSPPDAVDEAVQANIVAAGYGR
ncbi:MAG TPA: arabinofuranosidase catalytic domain-containing protein [Polyangiaceae bacterium]